MIEVFKTNVNDSRYAVILITRIHEAFKTYEANFDLEDCDNILRVRCTTGKVDSFLLIKFLNRFGVYAELLPD